MYGDMDIPCSAKKHTCSCPGIARRFCPGRPAPPDMPSAWGPDARKRSGGLPAPPSPATTLTTEGFTAEWRLPMAELKACVREALDELEPGKGTAVTRQDGQSATCVADNVGGCVCVESSRVWQAVLYSQPGVRVNS